MGGVNMMARKETAEFISYTVMGLSPVRGKREPPGDSPKYTFTVLYRRDKKRKPAPSAEKRAL
jgi:hypothetical protein